MRINVQQGELAHWLQIIADSEGVGTPRDAVPDYIVKGLFLLLCIEEAENANLVITDKGRLALRMQGPGGVY